MTTLREGVRKAVRQDPSFGSSGDEYASDFTIDVVCNALEATGAPAYMRVAADLRGEWVEGGGGE